jgi:hypothetical protein
VPDPQPDRGGDRPTPAPDRLAQRELHSREVNDGGEAEIALQRDEAARLGDERSRPREISAHGTDDGDPPGALHNSPRHGCQARRRKRALRARRHQRRSPARAQRWHRG